MFHRGSSKTDCAATRFNQRDSALYNGFTSMSTPVTAEILERVDPGIFKHDREVCGSVAGDGRPLDGSVTGSSSGIEQLGLSEHRTDIPFLPLGTAAREFRSTDGLPNRLVLLDSVFAPSRRRRLSGSR